MDACGTMLGGLAAIFIFGRILSLATPKSLGRRKRRLIGTALALLLSSVLSYFVTGGANLITGYILGAIVMAIVDAVRGDDRTGVAPTSDNEEGGVS